MDINEVRNSYRTIIDNEQLKYTDLKKKIFNIGSLRLGIIFAGIVAVYFLWENTLWVVSVVLITSVIFGSLLLFHNKLFRRRLYSEIRIRNAENELKALDYDFSAFDGAPDKMNAEHSFSLDLDLFGERSFFQSINRTVTSFGRDALANTLLYPFENKNEILAQQEAIKELASKSKLATHFRTVGEMSEADNLNAKDYEAAFSQPVVFWKNKLWTTMLYLVPISYILFIVLYIADIIPGNSFIYLWLATLLISSAFLKKTNQILSIFDKKTSTLDTYSQLFGIIENEKFDSTLLQHIQQQLNGEASASQAIAELKSHHNNLSLSVTFPVLLLFNPLLLWNIRYASLIEKWMYTHKDDIGQWFDAIARFDTLVSLAIFAYNHPDYCYPEIADNFVFDGKDLGHPLINRDVCVRNDVHIPKKPYFLVITGANMAGKSTYLRTIGINHILACAGIPVCANYLKFFPGKLVTNLRTADSLADNESYFYAELKRLKMIIDRLQSGEELFIILDEILKGTNSEDKQKGSLALMRQLIALNGNGVIATHDLVLGNLEKEYPEYVKDYRFEADIKDDNLSFSYRIREGIAQNMNASFLMKKMGITGL